MVKTLPTFQALRYRNFRILWTGLAVSSIGTWMQIVALGLLVLELTGGSAAALGTVSLVQALSYLLFAPLGGSLADHSDRRRMLIVTQVALMGLAIALGSLTAAGLIRFWMILVAAFLSSAILSFDQPCRNAFITSLVPKEHLMNAISLQSAVFNGASILGPALAGLALNALGYAGAFFLNAASYLAVLGALLLLHTVAREEAEAPPRKLLAAVREALGHVRRDAVLPSVLTAFGALLFFGPSAALMLPLFASRILHAGPSQLGLLFSAVGTGTVLSALMVASLGDFRHKGALLFGAILVWTVALAAFGFSSSLWLSAAALLFLGAAQNATGATAMTLLQTRVPPEMRGRAMSLNTLLIMCVRPLGDFPAGVLIGALGLRPAVLLGGAIVVAVALTLFATRPALRKA